MKELHILLDFENVQPTLEQLSKLAPGFTDVWLFHGPHQTKQAQALKASDERVTPVPRSGAGKNALDFHLSFYLGYTAAKHPDAALVVVANDKGYDPMIAHARILKFTVRRVGFKPKATAPAKKTPTKKAPAQKAPAKPPVAKKTAAKKAAPKAAPPAKAVPSKEFTRIQKGLAKMGDKRPVKRKSLLKHVQALLGKDSTPEVAQAMLDRLAKAGVFRISGEAVVYGSSPD